VVELRVELRKGPVVVSVVGTSVQEIESAFGDALKLLAVVESKLKASELKFPSQAEEGAKAEEIPALAGAKTIREAITHLMSSNWGQTPRLQSEMMSAMKAAAVHYPRGSVATELRRMTKLGLLRRFRSREGYRYVRGAAS
jgi:hypothetical protein